MNARTKLNLCLGILRIPSYQVPYLQSCIGQQSKRFYTINSNFPSIKIKGENTFGEFTNRPNYQVFASVVINGEVHSPPKKLPVHPNELVEGSLYAVEAVTKILATKYETNFSELSQLLTPSCFRNIHKIHLSNHLNFLDFV